MDPQSAVDLGRDALMLGLLVAAPVLLTGLVVGLVMGVLQALTQVHEQAVSYVPKLVLMVLALSLTLPWAIDTFVEYARELIAAIPDNL
jgi:flagellar biosynthetic protein FliQ